LEALDNTNTVLGLVYSPSTDVSSGTVPMSLYTRVIPADSPLTLVYPGFAFASLSLASEEPYPSYAGLTPSNRQPGYLESSAHRCQIGLTASSTSP
jgi:hypothetical protein